MYLYWVTTEDHAEDWFIEASNAKDATRFHEDFECLRCIHGRLCRPLGAG